MRDLAKLEQLEYLERAFTVAEAKAAAEAFLTSTTSRIIPVTRIDDTRLGDGKPGPLTCRLATLYASYEDAGGQAALS